MFEGSVKKEMLVEVEVKLIFDINENMVLYFVLFAFVFPCSSM